MFELHYLFPKYLMNIIIIQTCNCMMKYYEKCFEWENVEQSKLLALSVDRCVPGSNGYHQISLTYTNSWVVLCVTVCAARSSAGHQTHYRKAFLLQSYVTPQSVLTSFQPIIMHETVSHGSLSGSPSEPLLTNWSLASSISAIHSDAPGKYQRGQVFFPAASPSIYLSPLWQSRVRAARVTCDFGLWRGVKCSGVECWVCSVVLKRRLLRCPCKGQASSFSNSLGSWMSGLLSLSNSLSLASRDPHIPSS
jgi:hypothetical protein